MGNVGVGQGENIKDHIKDYISVSPRGQISAYLMFDNYICMNKMSWCKHSTNIL